MRLDPLDLLDLVVSLDHQENRVDLERVDFPDHLDPAEKLDLLEHLVLEVLQENLDLLDL